MWRQGELHGQRCQPLALEGRADRDSLAILALEVHHRAKLGRWKSRKGNVNGRRKSTLNCVITTFKAALNPAFNQKRVASCDTWTHLNKFRGVDAARMQRPASDQATRLCESCKPDFR